jgi:segregation and condensation protein A
MLIDDQSMYTVRLDQFEGPLDLLLHLIEKSELDITTIALAKVADQYLVHVRQIQERDAGQISSFVVLAARLLVIKSRALLPVTPSSVEDVDDSIDLVRQLREYQHYKAAAAWLRQREQSGWQHMAKAPSLPTASVQQMPLMMTFDELLAVWNQRMRLIDVPPPTIPLPAPKMLTVADVVQSVRERLQRLRRISFFDLLPRHKTTRVDVVVSLWAVLEMIKRRTIVAHQDELFGPIQLEAYQEPASSHEPNQ